MPLRAAPVLAPTVNVTVPVPVPVLPPVRVMNAELLLAVQLQVAEVVTVIVDVPPLAPTLRTVRDNTKVQDDLLTSRVTGTPTASLGTSAFEIVNVLVPPSSSAHRTLRDRLQHKSLELGVRQRTRRARCERERPADGAQCAHEWPAIMSQDTRSSADAIRDDWESAVEEADERADGIMGGGDEQYVTIPDAELRHPVDVHDQAANRSPKEPQLRLRANLTLQYAFDLERHDRDDASGLGVYVPIGAPMDDLA